MDLPFLLEVLPYTSPYLMEQNENTGPPQRKPKRAASSYAVGIDAGAHQQMSKMAKKYRLTNAAYATAAITYFSERGLNPVTDRAREGSVIMAKFNERGDRIEEQIADLGSRLFGFLHTHEKNLYAHLQHQQRALFRLLNEQESSLARHLTVTEANLLGPILLQVVKGATDAFIARRLGEQIVLRQQNKFQLYNEIHVAQTDTRDEMVAQTLREMANEYPLSAMEMTTLPPLTPAPNKPAAAPEPAATTAPPAPKSTPRDTY